MKKIRHKEDLKHSVEDSNCIQGIYNYCDRWCERCAFTSRCLTYKQSKEKFGDPETSDINNAAFWERLSETFNETLDLLKEMAEEQGIDLDSLTTESDEEYRLSGDTDTVVHLLLHMSEPYIAMVDQWFGPFENLADNAPDDPEMDTGVDPEQSSSEADTVAFRDAVEVVRWYQYQIHVKLKRALGSARDEKAWNLDDLPKDSEGSAKVALVGIDRSISAWGKISTVFPSQKEETLSILSFLKRLRDRVEKEFPAAMSFVRPGFDDAE